MSIQVRPLATPIMWIDQSILTSSVGNLTARDQT